MKTWKSRKFVEKCPLLAQHDVWKWLVETAFRSGSNIFSWPGHIGKDEGPHEIEVFLMERSNFRMQSPIRLGWVYFSNSGFVSRILVCKVSGPETERAKILNGPDSLHLGPANLKIAKFCWKLTSAGPKWRLKIQNRFADASRSRKIIRSDS